MEFGDGVLGESFNVVINSVASKEQHGFDLSISELFKVTKCLSDAYNQIKYPEGIIQKKKVLIPLMDGIDGKIKIAEILVSWY